MFFGNSDPTFFAMMLSAFRQPGEDPTHVIRDLIAEFFQNIVLPGKAIMKKTASIFHWKKNNERRNQAASKFVKRSSLKPADFELLASFPVDRANPRASSKVRLMRSSLGLLYGAAATVRVPAAGRSAQMALPLAMVSAESDQSFAKKWASREFPNMEDPFELMAKQMERSENIYTDNHVLAERRH